MAGVGKKDKSGKEAVTAAAGIFRQHGGFIRMVLRFQAGTKFDHEDLFQGFFLVLIQRPVPPHVRDLKSYLYRAIVNYVLDLAHKTAWEQKNLKKYARETQIFIYNRPSRSAFIEEETSPAVARVVRVLQDRQAEAFVLRYRDNRSVAEIAAIMGVDQRTVSRYLTEGLKKLRRGLALE